MVRGDSIYSPFSLSKLLLPFDEVAQRAFNVTIDDINYYGPDVLAFVYHHSSDFEGGNSYVDQAQVDVSIANEDALREQQQ